MQKISQDTLERLGFVCAEPIEKGWSGDAKYRAETAAGEKYLLRITPKEKSGNREALNCLMQQVAAMDVSVCRPVAFGECCEGIYSVQTWIDGEDAEAVLPMLPDVEQYLYGMEAGRILRKLHTIPVPEGYPDWAERFNRKNDRKIEMSRACPNK